MDSLSFPIKMIEGSEPKIIKQNHDDSHINRGSGDSNVNNSNDTREETFADHMQKEPENDAPKNNDHRERDEDIGQENTADTNNKVEPENSSAVNVVSQVSDTDKGPAPTVIHYGEVVFAAPVEIAGAGTPIAAPVKDDAPLPPPIHAVVKTHLIEVARPELSQLEKTLPTYQVITGDHEAELKPVVQNAMPGLASAAAIKAPETAVTGVIPSELALAAQSETTQKSPSVLAGATVIKVPETAVARVIETTVTGVISPELTVEAQPEKRGFDLKPGEFEALEKPELHLAKTIKPVVGQAASIAPSTYMLAVGEPEIDLKAMAPVQEAVATSRSVLSTTVMGANAASALQTTNAASANAAAQVIAAIKADKNSSNIEVRLDPPELGRVRISFTMETADAVKAVLSVERAETLDHLRRNASQFIEGLKMAGFGSVDIEFSEHGASEFAQDMEFEGFDSDPSFISAQDDANEIVYLSLRDDAQLNVLV